jgi:cell division transport system permease protein
MSLTDARRPGLPAYDLGAVRKAAAGAFAARPQVLTPIVPRYSMAGRALLGVITVMSLLASLTLGVVVLVRASAGDWQAQVAREVTIQIRPIEGRSTDTEVSRAALITRAYPGIAHVRPYTREQSAQLLEPWLGSGLALDDLPIPRLIVVTLAADARPDLARLRQALSEQVPGASLDDHRGFVERMRAMTRLAVVVGFCVLGLMLGATLMMIVFATRGAMSANRGIVEVLHFVGAKNRFIAGQFQRHFLVLGLKGAIAGGGTAIAAFLAVHIFTTRTHELGAPEEMTALLGNLTLAPEGYAGIVGVIVLIAAATALTSRWTVHRTLASLD